MTDSERYVPGACNIGPKEVAKRRVLGWIGLVATLLLWATMIVLKTAPAWRLLSFVPAMLAALGYSQAHARFCVKYGFDGAYKFGAKSGRPDGLQQAESRGKDRRKAFAIIGLATLIGLAVAFAAYFFPL
jgi:hypothetical protein